MNVILSKRVEQCLIQCQNVNNCLCENLNFRDLEILKQLNYKVTTIDLDAQIYNTGPIFKVEPPSN